MLHWFKRNPEFLRQESKALASDSNYNEQCQCRDNLFISHGNIIVRLNKVHRFPILIIYTDATPYRLPMIFPLQKNLSNEQVKELASLKLQEAVKKIYADIQFYYHLRHQNNSGELCTLEQENLDSGSRFYGITTILQRARDWYAGHITQKFPPDSEEVEFCSHFNFVDQEIRLIYPEHFLHDEFIEGDCYATLYNIVPKCGYYLNNRYLYFGAFLDGIGKSGLFEQVHINLENCLFHEKLKTSLDLYNHPEIVNKLVADRLLLKAKWFHIDIEPKPFQLFKELVEIIGNSNYDNGIKRIAERFQNSLDKFPKSFLIGIRFPNRKGINEFQLFKIYESDLPPTYILSSSSEEKVYSILGRYNRVEAIEGEKLTKSTFHQRNSKRADYEILQKVSVNVFGVGAIGSEIADCLAKAGMGELILFDDQTIKAHNAVRHLAGLKHIGKAKVSVVAEILRDHNPFITIGMNTLNLYDFDISRDIDDNSIMISSVADDNVEGFVNEQFVIANRVAFYVRALRGGTSARIFRVIPGKDACFNCLSLYRKETKEFIEIPDDPAYPTLKNECNNPIRPASAADLKFVASFASRILIDYLQTDETDVNQWIWSSEALPGTPLKARNQIFTQHLSPHNECIYCHHDRQINVFIPQDKITFIQELISQNISAETGGVIAGWTDEKGNIVITDVSDSGPKALKSKIRFEKDIEYCQHFLDELFVQSNQKKVYVGEWHSHPSSNNQPSGTDIKSLSEISYQKEYLTDTPIMIIFSNTGEPSCTVHPVGKRYYHTTLGWL